VAVFRVDKTRDYTVMSNNHFKDKTLSLKAKGLLSLVLSLPDEWDYTLKGLTTLASDGIDSIRRTINELEEAGYIVRSRERNEMGQLKGTEYIIYEQPMSAEPILDSPTLENPTQAFPTQADPTLENPTQLNTKVIKEKRELNTHASNTHSIPLPSGDTVALQPEANGSDAMLNEIEIYREIIRENIEYDILMQDKFCDIDQLDEIVELMVETVCSKRKSIRVSGSDFPHAVVKSRLLKLDSEHIRFIFDCLRENTTKVRNIKQYLLATLFNAPTTIGNYYSSLVNHDLYGSSE
jgi:hypothetical protein